MSWSAGKTEKCCATCEYWGGCRSLHYSNRAETNGPGERGKCHAGVTADASQGPVAMGQRQCTKYKTWSKFR